MTEQKKRGRPAKEGELKTEPLNLRITKTTKTKLQLLCAAKSGASETYLITTLVDEKFASEGLKMPKPPKS